MTDVSSGYLSGEHKMIESGKGGPGLNPRSKEMTKKTLVPAADTVRDDQSVHSVQKSEKNGNIAPTVKVDDDEKASIVDSYASLRIAGSPRVKIDEPDNDEEDVDDEGAFGSEEEGIEYSDESYGQGDEEVEEEEEEDYESDGSFEDVDGGFSGYAKIAVDGIEFDHGKAIERKFSPYARIKAPDSDDAEHQKYIDRDFSPYARVSVAGNENERDDGSFARVSVTGSEVEREATYARVSVAGSEMDFNYGETVARVSVAGSEGKEMDRESFTGFARVSVAGSEADLNYGERQARVSIAGSEYGKEMDMEPPTYARVSVAGSEYGKEVDREPPTYARVSVAGSDHGKETDRDFSRYARVSVTGSEFEAGKDSERDFPSYARLSVAGSEAGQRRDPDREVPGYARISAVRSEIDYGDEKGNEFPAYPRVSVGEAYIDLPSPTGSSFKIKKYENELYSDNEKELSASGLVVQDDEDHESWDEDYEAYLELSPETRAKLQYQVRVVLVSPLFELQNRKVSAFAGEYKRKFGREVEETGFSSAARLCRAMPHVVQRARLEKDGELILVDSVKNRRAVHGIRSGLRRIVYDVLKESCDKISLEELEEKCSEQLGAPLSEILTEYGYDTPTVECLVKDMPDIVACGKDGLKAQATLCAGAEDPALTDGLLVKRSASSRNIAFTPDKKQLIPELENVQETAAEGAVNQTAPEPPSEVKPTKLKFHAENLKVGSSLTLRSLKTEIRRYGDLNIRASSTVEDEFLQARLRIRILLAFYNSGHGVELGHLCELYESTFKRSLDLQPLGFNSILELASSWQDIFLFQELRPDWVFLVPSEANRRILNTLRTGLRSSVYLVLLDIYPDGLEPFDFLHCLQGAVEGKLWEVLDANGYNCSELAKSDSFPSSKSDFQLADFDGIRMLLDDMMDFVRLGSNEDGSLVVKLISAEFPLIDLVDCKMEETDIGSFDELFVNLMMIAVDDEDAGADDVSENGSRQGDGEFVAPVGLVQSRVVCFENGGLRVAHSPTPDSLRLRHEIRLILASPEFIENGVAWSELNNVYKDRTGKELGLKVKSVLRKMPDIVCKESFVERHARLLKTPKNLRILSATRAGLRQVLFWALIKNPGGVWAHLLEGWFTDFAGMSFACTLQNHGYEVSKSKPLSPVCLFLKDMDDLLEKKCADLEVYIWPGEVLDPVHQDAALLGLSELMIQYDPNRGDTQSVSDRIAALHNEFAKKESRKVEKSDEEDHQTESESDERSSSDITEKAVTEAEVLRDAKEPEEPRVNLEISIGSLDQKSDEASVDKRSLDTLKNDGAVQNNRVPDEVADKTAVVEEKAPEEHLADKTVAPILAAGESLVEAPAADVVYPNETGESTAELEEATAAKNAVLEDRRQGERVEEEAEEEEQEEEYNADVEADVESGSGDNDEDKNVYVSGSRDGGRETEPERIYVLGGSGEHQRKGEDERVYVLGSSEGLKVRKDVEEEENDDSIAHAYAQLRVAGKGPAVNLDEWQFTDSEEDYGADDDDYEEDEDVEEEEDESGGSDTQPNMEQKQPRVTVAYGSSSDRKDDGKKTWVLPSKGLHVK